MGGFVTFNAFYCATDSSARVAVNDINDVADPDFPAKEPLLGRCDNASGYCITRAGVTREGLVFHRRATEFHKTTMTQSPRCSLTLARQIAPDEADWLTV